MFGMNVPEHYQPIISATIIWIEGYHFVMKQLAFDRIKRKILKDDLKRIHKNNFESVGSQDMNFSTNLHSNYVSINDFRPIEQNYSSIKILDYQTHGINNDIRINNAKKIEYTSNQLLPQEDFLEEWMIRQPIENLLPEQYPLSDMATRKIAFYHEEALSSVRKITFLQYTKRNLRRNTGIFSFTENNPLIFKKDSIMNSLTILPENVVEKAIQIFEIILKIGGEEESEHHYLLQIDKILGILVRSEDNMKEEIVVQIVKQISSRKDIYLRLLCCVCYFMKPTTKIYIPLLNFLYEEATIYENYDKEMLNYCFYHLIKNFDIERKCSPSLFEIFCAYNTRKIPITICFPKEKIFFIEGFTTVEDFINEIIEYYNLDKNVSYLLEINGYLMQKGILLEQFNKYSFIEQDDDFKWTDYKKFSGYRAVIVLKNVLDTRYSSKCLNLMYNYVSNQYLRGVYALRSQQMVQLAALKMHSQAENDGTYVFKAQNLITRRKLHFMSKKVEKEKIMKHIIKEYTQIKHISKDKAKRQFMRILSKSKGFNTHFFRGYSFVEELDEILVWIGVQKDRFLIVQPSSGRIMNSINYNKIKEWGKSSSQICLKVDGMNDIHLESKQISVICSVFENYVEHYVKLLDPIQE